MPGTWPSSDRVAMSPKTQGTFSSAWVVRPFTSGNPKIVNAAGAGAVSHSASIAAIFIF